MSKFLTHEDNEASNAQRCVTARVSAENIEWHGALTGCNVTLPAGVPINFCIARVANG